MTNEQFLAFQKEFFAQITDTCTKKNHDYTGGSGDAFYNFSRVESLGVATVQQGFLTRMLDKYCRLVTFSNSGKLTVENEGVQDALQDLAAYCSLMAGYLKAQDEVDFLGLPERFEEHGVTYEMPSGKGETDEDK
jgi:hypothetical protein